MEKKNLERDGSWRRANGVRVNREPTKNLGLMDNNERCLKSRGPIRLGQRQTCLGSSSMITATLLADLSGESEGVEM